jgi:2-iminobutanoate/2-iminopropanoate deaminase
LTRANADHSRVRHYPPSGAAAEAARSGGFRLPFSAAVRVGDVLYLSGQIGARADGSLPDGIEAQARQAMANVGAVLTQAGLGFGDVVHCLVMLADMAEWQAFNQVYLEHFDPERLPARSAFGASGLALGARVEIECKAYAGRR